MSMCTVWRLAEPATAELAARIRTALVNGRYEELGQIAGELVGAW